MKLSEFLAEKEDANIQEITSESYGQEVILDIHDVPPEFFTTKNIRHFAEQLCDEIGMKRGPIYNWGEDKQLRDNYKNPKINGISCVQFLYSSSITIHALDEIHKVFINVFSCKTFDGEKAKQFAEENIGGKIIRYRNIKRV